MIRLQKTPCPKCGKKGLHYADHPHAYGWKDYDKIVCRFCKAVFKGNAAREIDKLNE